MTNLHLVIQLINKALNDKHLLAPELFDGTNLRMVFKVL